jgi:hypothetical protein
MLATENEQPAEKTRSKMRDLARGCGWLALVLQQQDRMMTLLETLATCRTASAWDDGWSALELEVRQHFRIEEAVLAPAVQSMGQRAHVVIAEMRRDQVRRDLEDLRWPSWEDDGMQLRRLSLNLASHFAQEESWSYRALARQQDEHGNAELTTRCLALLGDAHSRPEDGSCRGPSDGSPPRPPRA